MRDFISNHYKNENEKRFNMDLINRVHDDSLVDYAVESCRSLEVLENYKVLDYEYNDDESTIDMRNYYRSRNERDIEKLKFREIKDSRYGELKVNFKISLNGEYEIVEKRFLIPEEDDEGYFTIKGNRYFMLLQLVDSSTFTHANGVNQKSFMPVKMSTIPLRATDRDGVVYEAPGFTLLIFKSNLNLLYMYFAKFGVERALQYLTLDKVVRVVEADRSGKSERDGILIFDVGSNDRGKVQVEVVEKYFEEFAYVKTMVLMLLNMLPSKVTVDDLEDHEYWLSTLGTARQTGSASTYSSSLGQITLTFFERMLDESNKKILKLSPANKKDIYSVVRWMAQNYQSLRKKDNFDLKNKRLRRNEYIASLLTEEFSKKLGRIIALGRRVKTIKKLKEVLSVDGDILIQQLHKSGILRFDDRINDMTFYSKLKYTIKGPNSIGNKNSRMISAKYKIQHPSYIGVIDVNVCGTSDPGSSGMITPFAKTDGLFFDGSNEPEDGVFDLQKQIASDEVKENSETKGIYMNFIEQCETNEDLMALESSYYNITKDSTLRVERVREM